MENLDISTVIFAVVAIFVVFKLRSVLGTRTGNERRPDLTPMPRAPEPPSSNVIPLATAARTGAPAAAPADRWRGFAEAGGPIAAGFDAIAAAEPNFNPGDFLAGARGAYEMIIGAFAAGDLNALRRLLAPDVLANFARAIETRRAAGQSMTTTLVSIDAADVVDARVAGDARMAGPTASLAVRFASKLVSATHDASGAVVEGSSTQVVDHLDVWTFSRQLGARDPNWLLTATETVH